VQLKRPKRIIGSLAAATGALLGITPSAASPATDELKRWSFDAAVLYYDEGDRVRDISANVLVKRLFRRGGQLVGRVSVDSLTGASASGATPAGLPQTFTTPSGNGSYVTPAGQTPLDDTFLDTRGALDVSWVQPVGGRSSLELGVSLSYEYDYFSSGINGRYSHEFNERNTTLNVGLAFAHDTVDPVGGTPVPFAAMLPPGDMSNKEGSDSKNVADLVIGVSQVFSERTIGQLNYSFSRSDGYLTDPYKLLSVVDPVTGTPSPGPAGLDLYRFESRPDQRTKHSLFAQVRHQFRRDILDGSYRFMTDEWGIRSQTLELRYRWRRPSFYVEPHARLYTQSVADFYRTVLFDGDPIPDHASADYRLGDLNGYTLGLKYGHPFGEGHEWGVRVELYRQSGRAPPEFNVGALQSFDLFPTVNAVIVQGGFGF
jgi:hypothetical protein